MSQPEAPPAESVRRARVFWEQSRQDLKSALSRAGGNRDEAARILGISRSTMFRKMRQLGVAEGRSRRGRRSRPSTR